MVTMIVVVLATILGYRFVPEVGRRREAEAYKQQLRAQIESEKMLLARRTREEVLIRKDPEYAGIVARDLLNLMRPGETIYRVEGPRIDTTKMRLNP